MDVEDVFSNFGYDPDRPVGRDDPVPERLLRDIASSCSALSPQERRVLLCLSHGMTLSMAADVIGIDWETARSHNRRARLKLYAKNQTHAVALALRSHQID
jgi:DNA-binding CsgD family transcriptional regulator